MKELNYKGTAASPGIAVGKLSFFKSGISQIPSYMIYHVESEIMRYENAKKIADNELEALYRRALEVSGGENAEIFSIHRIMLDDPDLCDEIEKNIRERRINAESAVSRAADTFIRMLENTNDAYLKARTTDVRDISERLIKILLGKNTDAAVFSEESILYTDDLTPSEAIQLDKSKILGIVTAYGSSNSHTAILARTNGIPCIVGCGTIPEIFNGQYIAIDGGTGVYEINPSEATIERYKKLMDEEHSRRERLNALKGLPTRTSEGKTIQLYANIGNPGDVDAVIENDAEGIGLFRTEFIFMERTELPGEDEQFRIYQEVVKRMDGKKTVIRTLDIGADKHAEYLKLPIEENPALGLRGIRMCLSKTDMFTGQLRALIRASAYGKLAIMFPMIASVWEIREIKKLIKEICRRLDGDKIKYDHSLEIGIMIETPAAALISDILSSEVDFFSIGTNDLTQYTLAADRQNPAVSRYYRQDHEAVLSLIKTTCDNAHKAGIWVGVCGEIASDMSMVRKLISLGVDELSVSPPMVLPIREKIRNL